LALKVVYEQPPDEDAVFDAVYASVQRVFGEYGASQADIKPIKYLPEKSQYIIRCSHLMLERVRAAIASIVEIKGIKAAIHVVGVSGTLKALFKKT
jgi:ribonuclease P/MRP protein subunit POP5